MMAHDTGHSEADVPRSRAAPVEKHCLNCGYDLRGLPEPRCPECGRGFDPDDPRTYFIGRRPWWYRPEPLPSLLNLACIMVTTLWLLTLTSNPHESESGACLFLPVLILGFGIDYLLRLLSWFSSGLGPVSAPGEPRTRRRRPWRLAVPALCGALAGIGLFTDWDSQARLALSRPALERAAAAVRAGQSVETPGFIGLYWVISVKEAEIRCLVDDTMEVRLILFATGQNSSGGDVGIEWCGMCDECCDEERWTIRRW